MSETPTLTAPGIVLRPLLPSDAFALFRSAGFSRETFLPAYRNAKLGVRDSIILECKRP